MRPAAERGRDVMGRSGSQMAQDLPMALETLAVPLRDQLAARGLSQTRLAMELWCDRSRVSRALSGREVPSRQLIEGIAELLGADVDETRRRWHEADRIRRRARTSGRRASDDLQPRRSPCALGDLIRVVGCPAAAGRAGQAARCGGRRSGLSCAGSGRRPRRGDRDRAGVWRARRLVRGGVGGCAALRPPDGRIMPAAGDLPAAPVRAGDL
jgi:transcriptional regulator with XRE-family HTH domain